MVAYAIAWLSRETGGRLDMEGIWKKQALPAEVEEALEVIAKKAFHYRPFLHALRVWIGATSFCKRLCSKAGFCETFQALR